MPESVASELELSAILIGLLGGLSIFLFGMEQMTDALKSVAGGGLRTLLERLTRNRVAAALTGAFVTAVIQSSSVTTVLVVGFVSAGLMTLTQSIGVIMGANVGTTITAQIVAFKVTEYALVLIAAGFGTTFLVKNKTVRHVGAMTMGLGMVFFGMGLMSDATTPLRTYEPFIELMKGMDRPLFAMGVAAAFTALVQSSSATTGIVIVLATQGFISLEAGIALTLGSNIGTCATAVLAALGKPRAAAQAAAVHVVFNVLGACLWIFAIDQLAEIVRALSPAYPDLAGTARAAAEVPRQVANAHTVFNVVNTAAMLPLAGWLAKLVLRFLPERPVAIPEAARPKFLDEVYLEVPALAAQRVRMEVAHVGERVVEAYELLEGRSAAEIDTERFREIAGEVEQLYAALLDYRRRVETDESMRAVGEELARLLRAANHLLSALDVGAQHLLVIVEQVKQSDVDSDPETVRLIRELMRYVVDALRTAVRAVGEADPELAHEVVGRKAEVSRRASAILQASARALAARGRRDTVRRHRLESATVEVLRRVYYFAKRIAKGELEAVPQVEVAAEPVP